MIDAARSDSCSWPDAVIMELSTVYFTVGLKYVAAASTRMPTSFIPAGLVTIVAESSGAPTDAPPIESCTGPKPIMRMPLVAAAGAADSSAAAASTPRYETIFIVGPLLG